MTGGLESVPNGRSILTELHVEEGWVHFTNTVADFSSSYLFI
jgi:hypothetical protein